MYSTTVGEFTAHLFFFFLTLFKGIFLSHETISSFVFVQKDIVLYFYVYEMRWQERVEIAEKQMG